MKTKVKMTKEQIELASTKIAERLFDFFRNNDVSLDKDNKIIIRKK